MSFTGRPKEKIALTRQPVLYLGFLRILKVKQPSASVNPVTNQGVSFKVFSFISRGEAKIE